MIDGFERFCELSPRDAALCELQPLQSGYAPVVFLFNDELLHCPPRGAGVCLLPEGAAIYAHTFCSLSPAMSLIAQKKCPAGEITVFSQGMPQALFCNGQGERIIFLNENFNECTVRGGKNILLLAGKNELCVLDRRREFFRGKATDWIFDEDSEELRADVPLKDFCGRTAHCVWRCPSGTDEAALTACDVDGGRLPPPQYILCVLLQDLLLGLGAGGLLAPDLAGDLRNLKSYFGDYVKVIPAPQYPFGAGIVSLRQRDVYEVKYFSSEVTDGKITNIKRTY